MTDFSISKISARIRKLLALASDTKASPNEVQMAVTEAQRLMQEHKLTEVELEVADGSALVDLPAGAEGFMASWKFSLVTATARSFFCEAVGLRVGRRRKVRIVGRQEDAACALTVFAYLEKEIERLCAERSAGEMPFSSFIDKDLLSVLSRLLRQEQRERLSAYRAGLAAGVASTLREQAKKFQESGETALVLVRKGQGEVMAYIGTKFEAPRREVDESWKLAGRFDYQDGFERGKQIDIKKQRQIGVK